MLRRDGETVGSRTFRKIHLEVKSVSMLLKAVAVPLVLGLSWAWDEARICVAIIEHLEEKQERNIKKYKLNIESI